MQTPDEMIQNIQSTVKSRAHALPCGHGTKTALSRPRSGSVCLDVGALSGVTEYEPGEFTFTAYAGTPVVDVEAMLAEHGQYLPFDPLWVERGATLGGTVAANCAGPRRYRFGGVRDFLIGVKLVDSRGELVRGGGKVVKNAAGFDLPKLMVGSLGTLGVLVELSFKVFPRPEAAATLKIGFETLAETLAAVRRLAAARLDLEAIDFASNQEGYLIWARIAGLGEALPKRMERLRSLANAYGILWGEDDARLWREARELAWAPADHAVVHVGLTPKRIPALEAACAGQPVLRRYSSAGQLAWIATGLPLAELDQVLTEQGLGGVVLQGQPESARLGCFPGRPFYQRIKRALDPTGRFVEA